MTDEALHTMLADILDRLRGVESKIDETKASADVAAELGRSAHQELAAHRDDSAQRHKSHEESISRLEKKLDNLEKKSADSDRTLWTVSGLATFGVLLVILALVLHREGAGAYAYVVAFGAPQLGPIDDTEFKIISVTLGAAGVAALIGAARFAIPRSWWTWAKSGRKD